VGDLLRDLQVTLAVITVLSMVNQYINTTKARHHLFLW